MISARVLVRWKRGAKSIAEFVPGDKVLTYKGLKPVKRVIRHDYEGEIYYMHKGEWVAPGQLFMKSAQTWQSAEQIFRNSLPYKGPMWDLEVDTDDPEASNYTLANGRIARALPHFTN